MAISDPPVDAIAHEEIVYVGTDPRGACDQLVRFLADESCDSGVVQGAPRGWPRRGCGRRTQSRAED
jgi:hypothetical protein